MDFLPDDWSRVFALETSVLELFVRGTALYFGILIFMRVMPRRTAGELATMDLILLLLIAEAASHSLGEYTGIADGMAMIAILMTWDYLLNMLRYHVPALEKLVSAPPLQVVRDGRLLYRNMRREFLTEGELMNSLRQHEVDDIDEVKAAFVEGEGQITVVKRSKTAK